MNSAPRIALIDDHPATLRALRRLLTAEGFEVHSFESAEALLQQSADLRYDCLLLDVNMPGRSGLDLQEQLAQDPDAPPIVFLTGRGDIPMTVRAMRRGAVGFLTKPVNDTDLLEAVRGAVAVAAQLKNQRDAMAADRERLARLTPREREVLSHLIAGKLNKQIAADLGTSEQTIKVHRMRIHEKSGLPSVAELVRIATRLGIPPSDGDPTSPPR